MAIMIEKQQVVDELAGWGGRVHMPDVQDYASDIVDKVLASIPDGWAKDDGEWIMLERLTDLDGEDWGEGQIGAPVYARPKDWRS